MLNGAKLVLQFIFIIIVILYRKWTKSLLHNKKLRNKSPRIIHYFERYALPDSGAFQAMNRLALSLGYSNYGQIVMMLPNYKENKLFSAECECYEYDTILFDLDLIKYFNFSKILQLKNKFQSIGADIIHCHLQVPYACTFALMSAVLSRIPFIIVTEHMHAPENHCAKTRIKERIRKKLLNKVIDKTITVSNSVRTALVDEEGLNAKNIVVIPNSVDTNKFKKENDDYDKEKMRLDLPMDSCLIGTVANLVPRKGHIYLMEASKEIILKHPQTIFLFAGDGPLLLQLRELSKKLNIEKHIQFLGVIENIKNFYGILDIFVLPSLFEGLPLCILEAMATALPVIATQVDGSKEAVEDGVTGILVPPEDSKSLACAILEIMENRKRGIEMGLKGRERAIKIFSVDAGLKKTISIYDELFRSI